MASYICPFCGNEHEEQPPATGEAFKGLRFRLCPEIPDGHIYEDREYGDGPRGALHRLTPDPTHEAD